MSSLCDGHNSSPTRRWLLKNTAMTVAVAVAAPMGVESYTLAEAGNGRVVAEPRAGLDWHEDSFEMVGGI